MMTRTRFTADPFAAMARDMDRLFESMFSVSGRSGPASERQAQFFSAPLNIWEDEDNVYAEMEVPGVKLNDIEILASGEELTIRGSRDVELPENAKWLRRERGTGAFERKTALPSDIDVEHVEAALRDGVLTITLPKTEARKPRRVAVKALNAAEQARD